MEICSPVASSMSISRADGVSVISAAFAMQVVGGAAFVRETIDDDFVSGVLGADGLACGFHHAVRILDARPAELLNDDAHGNSSPSSDPMLVKVL